MFIANIKPTKNNSHFICARARLCCESVFYFFFFLICSLQCILFCRSWCVLLRVYFILLRKTFENLCNVKCVENLFDLLMCEVRREIRAKEIHILNDVRFVYYMEHGWIKSILFRCNWFDNTYRIYFRLDYSVYMWVYTSIIFISMHYLIEIAVKLIIKMDTENRLLRVCYGIYLIYMRRVYITIF